MPTLKTGQELAAALGAVAKLANPIEELQHRGFQFAGDLAALPATNAARPLPSAAVLAKFAPYAAQAGEVTLRVGPPVKPTPLLAPGEYDIVVALRLTVVNQVLAGLHASQRIPHSIGLISLVDATIASSILAEVTSEFIGVPPDAQLGALVLTGPPVAIEVAGTAMLELKTPFTLTINTSTGALLLKARLTLVALVGAKFEPGLTSVTFSVSVPPYPDAPGQPALSVDADSVLKPVSPTTEPRLATLLQLVMAKILHEQFAISPMIRVPVSTGAWLTLVLQQVDIRTNFSPQGGVIVVGARLEGGPVRSNPQLLLTYFPLPQQNVMVRITQSFLQSELDTARQNGILDQALSAAQDGDIRVNGVRVEFLTEEVHIIVDGTKVDACAWIDVDFTATLVVKIAIQDNQLVITKTTVVSASAWGQFECLVLGAGLSILVALPALMINPVLGGFFATLFFANLALGGGGGGGPDSPTIVDLTRPIPGTELLTTVDTLVSTSEASVLTAQAVAGTKRDNINTYVYARVLGVKGIVGGGGGGFMAPTTLTTASQPLCNARVTILDQDKPSPSGDDVALPKVGETENIGPKITTTTSVTYQAPISDETLGTATTDFDGRVMFMLPRGAGTRAGTKTTTRTTEPTQPHAPPHTQPDSPPATHDVQTHSETTFVVERAPDLYFVIEAPGVKVDSRTVPNGLFLNYDQKHLGSPEQPLTYTVAADLQTQIH